MDVDLRILSVEEKLRKLDSELKTFGSNIALGNRRNLLRTGYRKFPLEREGNKINFYDGNKNETLPAIRSQVTVLAKPAIHESRLSLLKDKNLFINDSREARHRAEELTDGRRRPIMVEEFRFERPRRYRIEVYNSPPGGRYRSLDKRDHGPYNEGRELPHYNSRPRRSESLSQHDDRFKYMKRRREERHFDREHDYKTRGETKKIKSEKSETSSEDEEQHFKEDAERKDSGLDDSSVKLNTKKPTKVETIRDRRMFGLLMGTLQSFKNETEQKTEKEKKRENLLKKIAEDEQKEKEEAKKKRIELHRQRRILLSQIRILNRRKNMTVLRESKKYHYRTISLFIELKSDPKIFFLPAKHNDQTKAALERTKQLYEEKCKQLDLEAQDEASLAVGDDEVEVEVEAEAEAKTEVEADEKISNDDNHVVEEKNVEDDFSHDERSDHDDTAI